MRHISHYQIWAHLEVAYIEVDEEMEGTIDDEDCEHVDIVGAAMVGGGPVGEYATLADALSVFNFITGQQLGLPTEQEIHRTISEGGAR